MPQMPTRIAKTNILRSLEQKWNSDPYNEASTLKKLLQDHGKGLHQVYAEFMGFPSTHPDVVHLRDDWFDEQNGWWLPHQPIDPIIRQGLIEACTSSIKAGKQGRPIDCYWVCTGAPFEVWLGDGNPQLAVVITTAPPPYSDPSVCKVDEEIVVVRKGAAQVGERHVRTETPLPGQDVNVLRPLRVPKHAS